MVTRPTRESRERPHAVAMPVQNGHTHGVDLAPRPIVLRRYEWLDLPQETYPGFKIRLWINYPQFIATEITSGDTERVTAALRQSVVEHNGWVTPDYDATGNPLFEEDGETPLYRDLPAATDPAFWEAVPNDLAIEIMRLLVARGQQLPNSPATTSTD